MKFTQIPVNTWEKLQLNAGILLSEFDALTGTFEKENILGATSGGVSFTDVPTYTDYGSDVDNAPVNTKELKRIDGRAITLSGTYLTVDSARAKSLVAAADVDEGGKITPRDILKETDFTDIWWVGDYSNENGEKGGFIAIHLKNALSTGGFSLQSGNRAKGQFAFSYTAHYSVTNIDEVPYEMFIKAGTVEE